MDKQFLNVRCPHCGQILKVPVEYQGRKGKCMHCHMGLLVPPPTHQVPHGVFADAHNTLPPEDAKLPEPLNAEMSGKSTGRAMLARTVELMTQLRHFNNRHNRFPSRIARVLVMLIILGVFLIPFAYDSGPLLWCALLLFLGAPIAQVILQNNDHVPTTNNIFNNDGCAFWVLVYVIPPLALVWALLMDSEHPRKKMNIFRVMFFWFLIWGAVGFSLLMMSR